MNVMHCPLCVGLAALSVVRALAHLSLALLLLRQPGLTTAQIRGDAQPQLAGV
jgi:hypothetical protein